MKLADMSTEQLTLLRNVNSIIPKMVNYGVNHTKAHCDGYIAMWSNGSKSWFTYGAMTQKGESMALDANMFFIASTDKELIKSVIDKFEILPLYYVSTEAKFSGEAPPNVNEIVSELRKRAQKKNPHWGDIELVEF